MTKSVHLENWPNLSNIDNNESLLLDMELIMDICNQLLYIRSKENIRIRQPLLECIIVTDKVDTIKQYQDIIKDEVNVKNIIIDNNVSKYADQKLEIKFPVLGKRLPANIKDIIKAIKNSEWIINDDGDVIVDGIKLNSDEYNLTLKSKDDDFIVVNNKYLIKLNTNITDDIYLEGIARDFVRFIQQERKDRDFNISDKITINIYTESDKLIEAIKKFENHKEYSIMNNTLSRAIKFVDNQEVLDNYKQLIIDSFNFFILLSE